MSEKMNPEWKKKWIDALRSGEYPQGRGGLRDGDGYCCLGVLTDVCIRENAVQGSWGDWGTWKLTPTEVAAVTRLSDINPDIFTNGKTWPLAGYNDGDVAVGLRPHTFAEIADLIEEHL